MTDITRDQMIEFCDLQIKNGKHCVEEEYYFAAMRAALSEQPNTTERESVTEGESSLTGGLPNQSQDVAPCGDMKTAKEWFWNTTEDGTFNGPYATKNDALYDAIHGYEVFGDEETDCIFLIDGNCYPNPDYDSEYPQDDDNYPENIRGEISEFTKTQALDWVLSHIDKLIQTTPCCCCHIY